MEEIRHTDSAENIDFNKFRAILRHNLLWVIAIFILTNAVAYLYVRYTKELYESESEIKLDVKQDATELGIREFTQENNINLISGEIETIQSKLFLNNVIDSLELHLSYYSIGQLLNFELYKSSPFTVKFLSLNPSLHNTQFFIEQKSSTKYEIRVGEQGKTITGTFNIPVSFDGYELILTLKPGQELQKDINYSFVYNSRDRLLDYLQKNLTVEPLNFNAKTIRVSFKDNNPFKARDLVNGIDSLYLQYSNEQKNLANRQKIDWLTNELKQIETKMVQYEDYFENFTLKNKTSDLKEDIKKTIVQINAIDSQRYELTKRINEINAIMDNLATGDFNAGVIQQNSLPDYLNKNIEQLRVLYLEIDKMQLSYNENTFAYKQKDKEIKAVQNSLHNGLSGIKTSWLTKLQELNKAKKTLEGQFVNMPDKNTQFNKNERFYKLYEELYLTLIQHKSEFEIAQAGSTPDFKLLSTATLPLVPISPNKPIIYGIGFVAGIVINIFLIGILYLLNDKITNVHEVERHVSIPLLGVVPSLRKQNGSTLHISAHPKSMVSEAIRTLRTNLDFFSVNAQKKIIAISSTVSGEGKSFIATNLGGVMALSRKKVVLLDLDMRKPKASISETDPTKGISTILIRKNSWQECVAKTSLENFDFIPSGPQPPNPSELLLNGEFTSMLEELKLHYDFILMDTPPVGLVTDGIMAMKRADISIYVFRANYSKKEFMHSLQRIIKVNKFTNVTTLLNALPATHSGYYGTGYYEDTTNNSWLKSLFKRA